ncbi:unnamed protein product, partial [Iphiclides podalirius]
MSKLSEFVVMVGRIFGLRDVHISYQRWSSEPQRRLSAAINWDANRDPSQKLSVDVQLDNKGRWHRAGHLALYYPGRVVNGEFEFLLKGGALQNKAEGHGMNNHYIV